MSNARSTVEQFHSHFANKDWARARELLHDELSFEGPIDRFSRAADYIAAVSVFELPDGVAADILEVSPQTFRKRLSRARDDLHAFMTGQCGLVRAENPCRCARKTAHFIKMGFVDPARLKFHRDYRHRIRDVAKAEAGAVFGGVTEVYPALYRDQPFADPPGIMEILRHSLQGTQLGAVLDDDNA